MAPRRRSWRVALAGAWRRGRSASRPTGNTRQAPPPTMRTCLEPRATTKTKTRKNARASRCAHRSRARCAYAQRRARPPPLRHLACSAPCSLRSRLRLRAGLRAAACAPLRTDQLDQCANDTLQLLTEPRIRARDVTARLRHLQACQRLPRGAKRGVIPSSAVVPATVHALRNVERDRNAAPP